MGISIPLDVKLSCLAKMFETSNHWSPLSPLIDWTFVRVGSQQKASLPC